MDELLFNLLVGKGILTLTQVQRQKKIDKFAYIKKKIYTTKKKPINKSKDNFYMRAITHKTDTGLKFKGKKTNGLIENGDRTCKGNPYTQNR